MNPRKILIGLALAAALTLSGLAAYAAPHPPHHGMPPMMGGSAITGYQQHLYVFACGKIMQYSLADLKLIKTVELPKPAPPAGPKPEGKEAIKGHHHHPPGPPHPPGPGPQGFWVGDNALYVMAGPMLYKYSLPDLTLKTKVELPKPEPPQAAR
jgi:hypothetical protein